jgi:hypothetical protein
MLSLNEECKLFFHMDALSINMKDLQESFERLAASLFDCRKRIAKYQRADNWVRCGTYKQPKHRQRSAQLERWGAEREFRRLRRRGLL